MVYAAMVVLYVVHAHLLFRVGVTVGQWEFWASLACLGFMNLVATRLDVRSWRWRRF